MHNMMRKAAIVRQMFQSEMLHGNDAVKKTLRQEKKMSYHGAVDMYFVQKRTELIGRKCHLKKLC